MSDDLRDALVDVGERFDLGEYEVEAYLAVLEHGRLTAAEIAERTDVPRPRVYDTVRSLADRGLVELRESRPLRVVAVDPEQALGDAQATLSDLIEGLEARYTAPAREAEAASLVRSRSTIIRRFEEAIAAAEYELALSVTPDLVRRFEEDLVAATDRGVSVDLLVAPADRAPDPGEFDYAAACRVARTRRGITTPVVAVADGDHSVYATQDALRDDRDRYGVVFNRSALGFLVSGFFNTVLWTTTEETLYEDEGPRSLPRRYASIRRCVKDLIAREDDHDRLYASIEGRDVETGAPRVVRGRVVDLEFVESEEVAGLVVDTADRGAAEAPDGDGDRDADHGGPGTDGRVTVGGRVAAFEDVEAREIRIGTDEPPADDF